MTNKKTYLIPETATLSLESVDSLLLNTSKFGFENAGGDSGRFNAPKSKTDIF